MDSMYDFEPETVKKFLKEIEKVAIQMPDGLRPKISEIGKTIKNQEIELVFLATSCYGACDIADKKAEELGCDALIHYGHSEMDIQTKVPVLFVEARMEAEPFEALRKVLPELGGRTWGLITTVQHVQYLDEVKQYLENEDINSIIGEAGPRAKYPGQILGCDWGSAKSIEENVDGFLYIGTGEFHPLGVRLATDKPVFSVNPLSGEYEKSEQELEDFLRKRWAVISKADSEKNFGVLVSTKRGQKRMSLAEKLAAELERNEYTSYILVFDELSPESLENFQLDAFVNTACPRIPFSDRDLFQKPVLTPFEVRVMLGEEKWEDYKLDEISTIS